MAEMNDHECFEAKLKTPSMMGLHKVICTITN